MPKQEQPVNTYGTEANNHLHDFSQALKFLKEGKVIARDCWEQGTFIFRQVPNEVPVEMIPKMSSLPDSVKKNFKKRTDAGFAELDKSSFLNYDNQIALVTGALDISSWSFNTYDLFAEDRIVIEWE